MQAANAKQKEPSLIYENISKINCTMKSNSRISIGGAAVGSKAKKKKSKKKKGGPKQVPHQTSMLKQ